MAGGGVAGGVAGQIGPGRLPKLIVGARLVLTDSAVNWLALPVDRAGYQRLSRMLSLGKRRATKGECHLTGADLLAGAEGMILIALPPDPLCEKLVPGLLHPDLLHPDLLHPVARRLEP